MVVDALSRIQALSVQFPEIDISDLDQLGVIDHAMIEFLVGDARGLADRIHTLLTNKVPKPSVATVAGLRTILCHVEPGLKNENWFLHPDLYFFAQYWVGPFNRNFRYQGAA